MFQKISYQYEYIIIYLFICTIDDEWELIKTGYIQSQSESCVWIHHCQQRLMTKVSESNVKIYTTNYVNRIQFDLYVSSMCDMQVYIYYYYYHVYI